MFYLMQNYIYFPFSSLEKIACSAVLVSVQENAERMCQELEEKQGQDAKY